MAPALDVSPPPVVHLQRGMILTDAICLGNDVYIIAVAGTPTGGDGWAGPGTIVIDYSGFKIFQNTNTKASPTWTQKNA